MQAREGARGIPQSSEGGRNFRPRGGPPGSVGSEEFVPVTWMRHSDIYRDPPPSDLDWVAFDGNEIVGRVMQYQHGKEQGQWLWSMTVLRPGADQIKSGTSDTIGEAGQRVVEA